MSVLTRGFFRRAFNAEPSMAISGIAALIFMAMPYAIVPIRRGLGLPTHQWDTDPATSHVRCLS